MKQPFRIDLENIKRNAREHMAEGAVTDAYGADESAVIEDLLAKEEEHGERPVESSEEHS